MPRFRSNIDMSEDELLDGLMNGTIQIVAASPSVTSTVQPPKIPISQIPWECRGTQTTIRYDLAPPGEPLGLDVEFQNYKVPGEKFKHRIGCMAIVNTAGEVVFHAYFAYGNVPGVQKRYPGAQFMVEAPDFLFQNGALQARKAEKAVKELVRGREIVVHDKTHDQTCFFYETDALKPSNSVTIVDTQRMYSHLAPNGRPSLSRAYSTMFDDTIQNGPHSPVEDARTAVKLHQLEYPYDRIAEAKKLASKSRPKMNPQKPLQRRPGDCV
ncbi:hypothetical protein PRZ48_007766 [Zasmidium cellare]|uniref:Exonuclease domain-containing protein n=1 Tax=Zasmidium cellare TaxID=395010 RepID=A0ABR0EL16_ZASCE|nr:hypothetical protein PRZ48_007766 [Zasmidium cellare]